MPKFLLAALAAFALLSPALAQTAGKPYPPVAASYDRAAEDDADLAQLMKILRNAAQAKDTTSFEATISPGFVALDCSASPLKPCGPGKARAVGGEATRKQKPFERMRLAFCCEGKPAPDGYLLALSRLGLQPAEVVVYEDSDVGFASALAAGITEIVDIRQA